MNQLSNRIDEVLACAYVRGHALRTGIPALLKALLDKPLDALTEDEQVQLMALGKAEGLKLYRFKNHQDLPRVQMTLGFLYGIMPESLLDVGSGRGVFLFPFLRHFPDARVTSLDLLPHRVELLEDVRRGGFSQLTALAQDITQWDEAPDHSFDAVTLLEVLEHIPNVEDAIRAAVRLARTCVVVTVPSKPDNNPEHIHLLTKDILTDLFHRAGVSKLHFSGVNGHLFMAAWLDPQERT